MKRLQITPTFVLGWVCVVLVLGCRKDTEEEPLPTPRNSAQIVMNGEPWNKVLPNGVAVATRTSCGSCWAERLDPLYKDFFTLGMHRYYDFEDYKKYPFESIVFGAIPLKLGEYVFQEGYRPACRPDTIPQATFYTHEFDAGKDQYTVLPSEKQYFRVTKLDNSTGYIEGEFMMTFIRTRKGSTSTYPDTLRIQPSQFSAFIGANN
ncbi:MAG: hypothetical protein ACK41O_16925 [Runella zeae]